MKLKIFFPTLMFLFVIGACSSEVKKGSEEPIHYPELIEQHTRSQISYEGLQNAIDIKATFIATPVSEAQQNILSDLYQWNPEKKLAETEKEKTLLKTESRFFISIYTPDKNYDNLDKNKTLWRVFLETDGKQWDAKVKKIKLLEAEIKAIYPYYTSFNTAYEVTFPIATSALSLHPFTLNITGPIAKTSLKF